MIHAVHLMSINRLAWTEGTTASRCQESSLEKSIMNLARRPGPTSVRLRRHRWFLFGKTDAYWCLLYVTLGALHSLRCKPALWATRPQLQRQICHIKSSTKLNDSNFPDLTEPEDEGFLLRSLCCLRSTALSKSIQNKSEWKIWKVASQVGYLGYQMPFFYDHQYVMTQNACLCKSEALVETKEAWWAQTKKYMSQCWPCSVGQSSLQQLCSASMALETQIFSLYISHSGSTMVFFEDPCFPLSTVELLLLII